MKLKTHTIFVPLLVLSAVLGLVMMSVPKNADWEAATTDVFLFVGEASSSSSEASSSSSSSSSTASSTASTSSTGAAQSSVPGPSGEYRHHETRMREIIERIMRDRLRHSSSSSSSLSPVDPIVPRVRPPRVPFDFLFSFPRFVPSGSPCMEMQLPVFIPDKTTSGSGTIKGSAPEKDIPVSMEEDLDPDTYGWVSSNQPKDLGWIWEKIGTTWGTYFGTSGNEWIIWVIAVVMFFCTVRAVLRMHDRLVDFFIMKAKDWNLLKNE